MEKTQSLSERFTNSLRVKVTKNESDSRNSLCGEPMQVDSNGNEYFEIPAHQAKYQKAIHSHYVFGEEFAPGDELKLTNSSKPKYEIPVVKPRGNPNWRKVKTDPMVKSTDYMVPATEEDKDEDDDKDAS